VTFSERLEYRICRIDAKIEAAGLTCVFCAEKRTFAERKATLEHGVQDDAAAFVMVLKEKSERRCCIYAR
jgi:hypothetical protein